MCFIFEKNYKAKLNYIYIIIVSNKKKNKVKIVKYPGFLVTWFKIPGFSRFFSLNCQITGFLGV